MNLYQGVSRIYGVVPWYYILGFMIYFWGGAFAFIWVLAALGARRLPLLFAVAATTLLAYSLIGHKEYRFIYPVLPLIVTLAGLGTVELIQALCKTGVLPCDQAIGVRLGAGLWVLTSIALLASAPFQYLLTRDSGEIKAFHMLSASSATCGIGLYKVSVWKTPGYSYLRSGIALYELNSAEELTAQSVHVNSLIADESVTIPNPGFDRRTCFPNGYKVRTNQLAEPVCVWVRGGSCVPGTSGNYEAVAPD
jgi:GPI mannosyltransferase 3